MGYSDDVQVISGPPWIHHHHDSRPPLQFQKAIWGAGISHAHRRRSCLNATMPLLWLSERLGYWGRRESLMKRQGKGDTTALAGVTVMPQDQHKEGRDQN
uniref:Uncharacterized protein n=1 Tax=Oryza punctata TaxID=4537 RepID=A0A0E0L9Q9_ORYPU